MKLLFVHSAERLKEDINGKLYTDGTYNIEVWDRYLSISEDFRVIFRKDKERYDIGYAKEKFNPLPIEKGIKVIEVISRTNSIKSYFNLKKNILNNKIIEKAVLDCNFLIARLPCGAGYTAIKYAKQYKKPYLIEVVGCPWDTLWNHSIKGKILAPKSYLNMRKALKNAPYAIYVTNEFLQRRYPCKGESIGCSDVTLPTLDDSLIEKRLNKIECMDKSKPIIFGTIGAVNVKYKGQQGVIKAISELNKEGYNIEYHLVGGGDNSYLMKVAEKYNVADKVKFLGTLPHERVFDYLDDIDIYIQPSKTEGLPRALIEAMSRGCPAIGSNSGGIPELLEQDCIFNKSNYKELIQIILKSRLDKDWLKNKAKRNFEESKKYDKKKIEFRRSEFLRRFRKCAENNIY